MVMRRMVASTSTLFAVASDFEARIRHRRPDLESSPSGQCGAGTEWTRTVTGRRRNDIGPCLHVVSNHTADDAEVVRTARSGLQRATIPAPAGRQ